jgi:FkbM family methyltransferase
MAASSSPSSRHKLLKRILNPKLREGLAFRFCQLLRVSPIMLFYRTQGILQYDNFEVSGEQRFVTRTMKGLLTTSQPVFADVGANVGNYALMLREAFPTARILAFEPNPHTFEVLQRRTAGQRIECFCLALGDVEREALLFTDRNDLTSQMASLSEPPSTDKGDRRLTGIPCRVSTLPRICEQCGVSGLDLLKVDAEGYEFSILKGAQSMLVDKRIRTIMWEFNEMNVYQRVFLKDFFDLLSDYRLYRLARERLIPLPVYRSSDEIFQYHNLAAVRKDQAPVE